MPFHALGLEANILKAVQEAGYSEPTPIQAAAVPLVLAGTDVIGIAQTGTGKTAAFTLPILTRLAQQPLERRRIRVLVIAPTRELVVQIEENVRIYARHLRLRIATVYGGVGENPQKTALNDGADIVIATPGRLLDLMGRRFGDFSGLEFLVLDEADRMLDMGFLPSIQDIVRTLPRQRQTLMFSATLSKEIEALTHQFQRSPKLVQIGRRADPASTVTQLVYEVPHDLKMSLLLHLLRDPGLNMVLIFSRTKHGADRVAKRLEQQGIRTGTLHSNRSQNQRLRALKDFKSGSVRVLVATDIAARGIDVDGISHVVNYDFPKHPEDYVHRIGRTGRALAIGEALSFATPEDHSALRGLERFIGRGLVRKRAEGFNYHSRKPSQTNEQSAQRDFNDNRDLTKRHHVQPAKPHRPHKPHHPSNAGQANVHGKPRHAAPAHRSNPYRHASPARKNNPYHQRQGPPPVEGQGFDTMDRQQSRPQESQQAQPQESQQAGHQGPRHPRQGGNERPHHPRRGGRPFWRRKERRIQPASTRFAR